MMQTYDVNLGHIQNLGGFFTALEGKLYPIGDTSFSTGVVFEQDIIDYILKPLRELDIATKGIGWGSHGVVVDFHYHSERVLFALSYKGPHA